MRLHLTTFLLLFLQVQAFSQADTYILNGNATQDNCNCYTLTQPQQFQNGSVWNATKIDLQTPFDFTFNVYLGCPDQGADGMVFILQPISTSIGNSGEGMGFDGIVPSIGISLDTYQNINRNDPVYDHLSIQSMGRVTHDAQDLAPVVQASATSENIEDCQWHTLRIAWDPATHNLSTYFDGVFRQQANVDLIGAIFNNDPMVYWGFSAATGGEVNLQRFCTALNPKFNTNLPENKACIGTPVSFDNISESFAPIASFHWDFGDNTTSSEMNPPPHNYAEPGIYEVKLVLTGLDGCLSDTLKRTISIGDYPTAAFEVTDTCQGFAPRLTESSFANVGTISQWEWRLDGAPVSTSQQPILNGIEPGPHTLTLTVQSDIGCASQPVSHNFIIERSPAIDAQGLNGCVDEPVQFNAWQLDNATWISYWIWDFGDGGTSSISDPQHIFNEAGDYQVSVSSMGDNGCASEPIILQTFISRAIANAGNDTLIMQGDALQLSGTGGGLFEWSPATWLSDPGIANPIATPQDDITYTLTVTNNEGCIDTDEIKIEVFKGSYIYVPTGFTPDANGLNDVLIPMYGGIKTLHQFSIYNRWGERIFFTKNMNEGWDGRLKGKDQGTGVFVWMIDAVDYAGKVYKLKGSFSLIR